MEFLIKKWRETPINRKKTQSIQPMEKETKKTEEIRKIEKIEEIKEQIEKPLSFEYFENFPKELNHLLKEIDQIQYEGKFNKNMILGSGDFKSPLLFIGEAPGEEENIKKKPFAGPSGQLLEKILTNLKIDMKKLCIIHSFFWQTEGNRPPNDRELELTKPILLNFIKLQQPVLIVCLGSVATKTILGTKEGIGLLRGKFKCISFDNNHYYDLFPTWHPSYILKNHKYMDYNVDFLEIIKFLESKDLYEKVKL